MGDTMMNVFITSVFLILGLWFGVAFCYGAIQLRYRPFVIIGMASFFVSISAVMSLLSLPYEQIFRYIGLICLSIFGIKYGSAWRRSQISLRQILFFTHDK
jgi:predicted transporter